MQANKSNKIQNVPKKVCLFHTLCSLTVQSEHQEFKQVSGKQTSALSQRKGRASQPSITFSCQAGVVVGGGGSSTTTTTRTWLHLADSTYSRARPKNKKIQNVYIKICLYLHIIYDTYRLSGLRFLVHSEHFKTKTTHQYSSSSVWSLNIYLCFLSAYQLKWHTARTTCKKMFWYRMLSELGRIKRIASQAILENTTFILEARETDITSENIPGPRVFVARDKTRPPPPLELPTRAQTAHSHGRCDGLSTTVNFLKTYWAQGNLSRATK